MPSAAIRRFDLLVGLAVVLTAAYPVGAARAAPVPAARPLPPEPNPESTPGEYVWDFAYSQDRRLLAVVDGQVSLDKDARKVDRRLTVFDAGSYRVVHRVSEPAGVFEAFRTVRFAPDGKLLYLTCLGGAVHTCDLGTGEVRKRLDADSGNLFGFTPSPDGKQFATFHLSRGALGQARHALWDASTFKLVRDLDPALGLIGGGVFAPDGAAAAFRFEAKGAAGVVELDPKTGAEVRRITLTARTPGAKPIALPAAYSPDGNWLVAGGGEAVPIGRNASRLVGYLRVWDRAAGTVRTLGDGPSDYFRTVALSPDGKRLFAGTRGASERTDGRGTRWGAGRVHCWDTTTWKELWSVETDGGDPHLLAVAPSGRRLWVADRSGLWLMDADTGKAHGSLIQSRHD